MLNSTRSYAASPDIVATTITTRPDAKAIERDTGQCRPRASSRRTPVR